MPAPSGYHVIIDGNEYAIAEEIGSPQTLIRPHYLDQLASVVANRTDIPGISTGAQNLKPEIPLWELTDWSGGEGGSEWDEQDPSVFRSGQVNPRIGGKMRPPPARTDVTVDATAPTQAYFANSTGVSWLVFGTKAYSSPDGLTWTSRTTGIPGGSTATAVCAGGSSIYISYSNTPFSPNNGNAGTVQVTTTTNNDAVAVGGARHYTMGQGFVGPYVYLWSGKILKLFDTTAAFPTTYTQVYTTDTESFPATFYGGLTEIDNGVAMFYSSPGGDAQIHTFLGGLNGVGTPIWGGDSFSGFTVRCIGFHNGILYAGGTYSGQGFLFARDMQSGVPTPIGYFRKVDQTTLTPVSISPGIGSQVLIGMAEGYVFVYDAEADSISELDNRQPTPIYNVNLFLDRRMAAYNLGGTGIGSSTWNTDDQATQTGTFQAITPPWELGLPSEQNKVLLGFWVITEKLTGSAAVTIEYQINKDGTWHSAGTVNTSSSSLTNNYLQVSTAGTGTVKAPIYGIRYTLAGGAELLRLTGRFYNMNSQHLLEIVLKFGDFDQGAQNISASDMPGASTMRDRLFASALAKNVVQVSNYYRYTQEDDPRPYLTYSLMAIEDVSDIIVNGASGYLRLTLRDLSP